ncbi:MAG: 2,3,4,5-tetrahydropyridine-2,6-dicarboxylate N-succinyltransferase [Candidatus Marinimicrobia bacterium]|nr:2,3,4,5-tetrahydropyridine-2,6-dicarboxylate N-succinyltransferase [Candidatus Neomarinimicrobiota bacterium]
MMNMKEIIKKYYEQPIQTEGERKKILKVYFEFLDLLDSGEIRIAEKADNCWIINKWVKKGILLGFKLGKIKPIENGVFKFYDKETLPLKDLEDCENIRLVPGGSSIRKGSYIGKNVIIMPPSYINIGAYIDDGTMIDSQVLVGSCAYIGKNCHISAGTIIGGVLEPIGSYPVIIEDNVFIGGNCGVYEGTLIKKGAILGAGTTITASTRVYDTVNDRIIEPDDKGRMVIPEMAVVVPGSRSLGKTVSGTNISLYTPVIIKYRNPADNRIKLEDLLRD